MITSRRSVLSTIGVAALAEISGLSSMPAEADPLGLPIGFQGYDVRFLLPKNWDAGWREMRDIGFRAVDLVSFHGYGYSGTSIENLSGGAIRAELHRVGIACDNCQFSYQQLHEGFGETMQFAHDLRIRNVICAPEPSWTKTADDWKKQADSLNKLGERLTKEGFRLGYHNHELEFIDVQGVTPYDVLMQNTDPKLVRFQIDVGNLTFAGKSALDYIRRYTNRYFSMHAKDYQPGKTSVPVGKGIIDWQAIFTAIRPAHIENYFAEVAAYGLSTLHGAHASAWPADSIEELRESYNFLHNLKY